MSINQIQSCHGCDGAHRVACPSCRGQGLLHEAHAKAYEWQLCVVCEGSGAILCPDCIEDTIWSLRVNDAAHSAQAC